MLYNSAIDESVSLVDYVNVAYHGLALDATMSGYILIVPILLLTISFFTDINMRKWLLPYFCIISILLSVIFIADTVMYGFWQFKLDTTVFLYTDKPADAMASVSAMFIVLTLIAGIVVAALYVWLFAYIIPKGILKKSKKPLLALIMLPIAGVVFLMIRGGVGEGTANVSSVYYSEKQYLNHSAVNSAFSMFYSLTHQQDFSTEYQFYDDDLQRESLINGIYNLESVDSDTLISTSRPDIILFVWEGCGASFTGCLGAELDATPNLDKLAKEGIFFSNCQANSFRTDRGLVCVNCGWLGFPSASLMKIPEKCEKLPGLASTLKIEGYNTDFWYGGDISFTNMGGFMLQNGYSKTYSENDFSKSDRTSKWGVPDGILLDKVLENIKSKKSPFFTSIMTLSSHEPWEVPYSRLDRKPENSFAYTDDCLGKFVNGLKASGKWDNTLLIIVPDHGAVAQEGNEAESLFQKEKTYYRANV
ncbi:MAG: sulfatase-like hydrolase/transferase [Bacteroidaceae bacterium]|nr:sulfatase-like hydrolase/transferase [Bacteroidaceae bacterium]